MNPIKAQTFEEYEHKEAQNFNNINAYCNNSRLEAINIKVKEMNEEEQKIILNLLKEYSDIFHSDDQPLTFSSKIKHKIITKDEIPTHTKSYRFPNIHKPEVEKQINKMLQQKIIRPSYLSLIHI